MNAFSQHKTSTQEHRQKASDLGPVKITIVTVSDSRTKKTDVNAQYLRKQIEATGNEVVDYQLIKDDPEAVENVLEQLVKTQVQVILFNGGTGISSRDTTFDVLSKKLEKVLSGFGEIFRMLSYEQVGAAAMLSRAVAGVYKDKIVISTPGSPKAVELAWKKLIAPELKHLAWEVIR